MTGRTDLQSTSALIGAVLHSNAEAAPEVLSFVTADDLGDAHVSAVAAVAAEGSGYRMRTLPADRESA